MIVPVRCFTCGMLLCDKWKAYAAAVEAAEEGGGGGGGRDGERESRDGRGSDGAGPSPTMTPPEPSGAWARSAPAPGPRSVRGRVLDDLRITKLCCRRHMLSNVDLMDAM